MIQNKYNQIGKDPIGVESTSRIQGIPVLMLLCAALVPIPCSMAQQSGVVGQAERQIKILQERSSWAQTQTAKAAKALSENDFESAFAYSKSALDALPNGGQSTEGLRALAMDTFSKASFALANQRISEGRYDDADLVVNAATDKPYSSTYQPLLKLQKDLRDPNRFNRTMTPGFITKIEEVKQRLNEAQGLYDSGRFDASFKKYEEALNLDPQNKAARLGMEQVDKQRADYAEKAYNERRSEMLGQVAGAWELQVPKFDTGATTIVEQNPIDMSGTMNISRKLKEIRIPQLSLSDETVRDAVDKLAKKARALDTTETDPANKGVNIVLKPDPTKEALDGGTRINISLNDIPLENALRYVAQAASLKVKIEPYAVALVPLSEPTETLITKEYRVPPGFIASPMAAAPTAGAVPAPATPGLPGIVGKSMAKDFLTSQGVTFPAGASATYLPSSSRLLVRNTQANLDLIDSLVEVALADPPKQVEIETRFLEVTQNNLQELGFDWLMGSFQLSGGSGAYGGGGTVGNQAAASAGNYPFVNPLTGSPAGAMSTANGNVTAGNVTAGNRTGTAAIQANALDALLFPTVGGPAPGILALAGVFSNPQFQVVIRALNQMSGIDLVSAPKVTVKSGYKATINVMQKFPYPRDYSPPQVPQNQSGGQAPAVPATPTSFQTRNVGVQLEVEPTVAADNYTIELNLSPQITEFEGYVNYGTPIQTVAGVRQWPPVGAAGFLGTTTVVLTPNVIEQPIFSVREVDTQVTVYDGATVVLGGLMREDVQKVQDKTPIVGDIPLVGSMFRSSANQRIKRNLLIFVTAGLLDPAGQPLIKATENNQEILTPDAKAVTAEAVAGDASTAPASSR